LPVSAVKLLAGILPIAYRDSDKAPALNSEKINELTAANWVCNIDGIKRDLNYLPQYNLEKGLTETLAWYKANHWL